MKDENIESKEEKKQQAHLFAKQPSIEQGKWTSTLITISKVCISGEKNNDVGTKNSNSET